MRYAIGLDIGISSVGYSVLELNTYDQPCRIEKLGSRIFDKAEHPKDGSSLAAPRREARSARRRLRRHRHRLERIRGLIVSCGILSKEELEILYEGKLSDIYEIRTRALDELISPSEFARVLIHLAQRRGYKSNRKVEEKDPNSGKMLGAVSQNIERCYKNGYRSIGEMFYKDDAFKEYKRNKQDGYIATVDRASIEAEAKMIFSSQRRLGGAYADEDVEASYLDILLGQRSFADGPACGPYSGNQVLRMRGTCTFEKDEVRAAKASYSFQLFNLWQHINNIGIISKGGNRPIEESDRQAIFKLAHEKKEISYAQIRKCINISDDDRFKGVNYDKFDVDTAEKKAKIKDLEVYHKIRACVEKFSPNAFAELSHDDLDAIGEALSKNQSDEKIAEELADAGVSHGTIEAVLQLPNFAKFGHLSVKACKKILPYLSCGLTYNKACEAAGYNFKSEKNDKEMYLPPVKDDSTITSPVVKRAISQTIKVINAIIREMGASPVYINIELARDLSRDLNERKKIEKAQSENAARNEGILKLLLNEYGVKYPTGQDIIKMKLWQEQDGHCLYSGEAIEIARLSEPGYVDIDHVVPYSICFDDRLVNKVLVLAKENRQKGNRLPLQYLQGARRDEFIIRVNQSNLKGAKKTLLLKESISNQDEWKQRNLQDTQFISSYLRGYIEDNLLFAPFETIRKRHVMAVNGAITYYVRKRWGIDKIRANGDLHHAVDAVVIGCITQGMINQISRYSYFKETKEAGDYVVDESTGELITRFPFPWPDFRGELDIRLTQNAEKLRKQLNDVNYSTYLEIDIDTINPPFVSRMCNHKNTGAAHKETVRSGKLEPYGMVISKVSLDTLKLDDDGEIKNYYNPDSDRLLYEALKRRLLAFGGDGKKAFTGVEFHKPKADGTQGPIVKKVKVTSSSSGTVRVQDNKGVADNDSMVRCDVFYVDGEGYYFVPVYVADTVKEALPQYAPVAGKDENNQRRRKLMSDDDFVFSLYPNDLICISSNKDMTLNLTNKNSDLPQTRTIPRGENVFLYYKSMDVSVAVLSGITHDNTYSFRSIGKTMCSIEKYEVDVLGNVRKVGKEKRQDYSKKRK